MTSQLSPADRITNQIPKVNVPLLRKAVEWVEEQAALPVETRTWFQGDWVVTEARRLRDHGHSAGCGTSYCVAGWVASQAYPELADSQSALVGDEVLYTSEVAAELLGLTSYDHTLFWGGNSAADIRRIAEELAGEKL